MNRPSLSNSSSAVATAQSFQQLVTPIADELQAVEDKLAAVFCHPDQAINELFMHGSMLAGKRLRPVLVLLMAKACGEVNPRHIAMAAALEMIHTATLVHDDILDEADVRRHVATLHKHWNLESGILFGDYLLSRAFYLLGTEVGSEGCVLVADATNRVCEGEMRQVAGRGHFEMSLTRYFEIIDGKTAALCRCATLSGAQLASASQSDQESAAGYGTDLGIAFQIADDVLDLRGDEAQTGKSTGRDYQMGKPTLPLILALEQSDPGERQEIIERLKEDRMDLQQLTDWLHRCNAVEQAQQMAGDRAQQATEYVSSLPGCSASIESLKALAASAVNRVC